MLPSLPTFGNTALPACFPCRGTNSASCFEFHPFRTWVWQSKAYIGTLRGQEWRKYKRITFTHTDRHTQNIYTHSHPNISEYCFYCRFVLCCKKQPMSKSQSSVCCCCAISSAKSRSTRSSNANFYLKGEKGLCTR